MSPDTTLDNAPLNEDVLNDVENLEPSEFDAIEQDVFGEGDEASLQEQALPPALDVSAADTPPQTTPEGMMPYGAYASEKTKRQEAMQRAEKTEAEAKVLRDELASFKLRQQVEAQVKASQSAQLPPDPIDDPQLHAQWLNQRLSEQANHQRLEMSEFMARQSLGTERVDAATQAFMSIKDQRPWVAARIKAAQSPHAEAVRWHEEQQILLTAQQAAAQQTRSGPQPLSAAQAANLNTSEAPVIPPNIANRTNAIPANSQETFDDIEQGLWG